VSPAPAHGRAHVGGLAQAVAGASLWGLSGTAAQVLLQRYGVPAAWLVTARMLGAGVILWLVLRPPFPRAHLAAFLAFSLLGLAAVQLTYFLAIADTNAPTATFLQYLGLPLIAVVEMARGPSRRGGRRVLAVALALVGTALLVLGGAHGLKVEAAGLVFGLLSAVTMAYYTLASVPLVQRYGSWTATTWGFLVGGAAMALWDPPWALPASLLSRPAAAFLLAFVVLFGTLAAFGLYLASLQHIPATEAGVAATLEPVSAALAAFVLLHVALRPGQYLGGALIVAAVLLLRLSSAAEPSAT
jgi:drug/metabolite transporter (DMT)-like permease